MRSILAGICVLSTLSLAQADEVWTSDEGKIVYERDIEDGQMAVFTADGITMYIAGLAGVLENRGTYDGIWVLEDVAVVVEGCPVEIVRPGTSGDTSAFWGQLEITFIDKDSPSIWIANLGECFDGLSTQVIARPVTAGDGE